MRESVVQHVLSLTVRTILSRCGTFDRQMQPLYEINFPSYISLILIDRSISINSYRKSIQIRKHVRMYMSKQFNVIYVRIYTNTLIYYISLRLRIDMDCRSPRPTTLPAVRPPPAAPHPQRSLSRQQQQQRLA